MFCPCLICKTYSPDVGLFLRYVRLAQVGWVVEKTASGREAYVCPGCAEKEGLKAADLAGVPSDILAIAAGEGGVTA